MNWRNIIGSFAIAATLGAPISAHAAQITGSPGPEQTIAGVDILINNPAPGLDDLGLPHDDIFLSTPFTYSF